jgi:hypothetical protein
MLASKPIRRVPSIAALRGGAGSDETLAARRRVIMGMAVAQHVYDDDVDGGVRGSALGEENHGRSRELQFTSASRSCA